jgi:hypothetical protein
VVSHIRLSSQRRLRRGRAMAATLLESGDEFFMCMAFV